MPLMWYHSYFTYKYHPCEWIRKIGLHCYLLQSMAIFQLLNIWWKEGWISRQRIMMWVISYHGYETTHTSHVTKYLWTNQHGNTALLHAAYFGDLPMVEYLVEKGAFMEAKDNLVRNVISWIWSHAYVTHEYMCVCECIWFRMEPLHWCGLQTKVIYQWLNIWWRKELIPMLKIM